ncbi:hypothetical protein Tco_0371063 [Tanacetum coccineum]
MRSRLTRLYYLKSRLTRNQELNGWWRKRERAGSGVGVNPPAVLSGGGGDIRWRREQNIRCMEESKILGGVFYQRSRDVIVVHEMFNGGVEMLSLYMRCSMEESRCRDGIILYEMLNGGVDMISLYMRCKTDESRWYRCTLGVKQTSRDAIVILYELQRLKIIVVHEMLNEGVEMVSLYMRCSTEELRWYRCT